MHFISFVSHDLKSISILSGLSRCLCLKIIVFYSLNFFTKHFLITIKTEPVQKFGNITILFKEVCYAHHGCIYSIKNIVKTVILRNVTN